jgi:hypothetical protein
MRIYGVATSEAIDSSGEQVDIAGANIDDMVNGKAHLNFEHLNQADDILGRVTFAKKIFSQADCANERELQCWNDVQLPLVYFEGMLYDKELHPGAIALAAIIRSYVKAGQKIDCGVSVQGATIERGQGSDSHILKRTLIRSLSPTLRPCNKTCWIFLLADDAADVLKSESAASFDFDTAPTHGFIEIEDFIFNDIAGAVSELNKTLTAGMGNVAPSQLTGGAALAKENFAKKPKVRNTIKAAIRDWNRVRPLSEVIKSALKDVSEDYIDHYADLAHDIMLKKGEPSLIRIGSSHGNEDALASQKTLIDGLYMQANGGKAFRAVNDAGQEVAIRAPRLTESKNETAKNAAAYYSVANWAGLHQHVPATAYFAHGAFPVEGGSLWHATQKTAGHTALEGSNYEKASKSAKDSGLAHKLALLDLITGNSKRNYGNVLVDGENLKHVDNDHAFEFTKYPNMHLNLVGDDIMHDDAKKWLHSLDPKSLAVILVRNKIPLDKIKLAIKNLKAAQLLSDHPIRNIVSKAYPEHDQDL